MRACHRENLYTDQAGKSYSSARCCQDPNFLDMGEVGAPMAQEEQEINLKT
jgi:hypothetical protein